MKIGQKLDKKSTKDVPKSSKPKVAKNPQKRGRKAAPAISRPALPRKSIGDDVIELFRATIFGPYLEIPKCNFQGQISKCLLLLELEQGNSKVLHIRHANGGILKFGIKEFTIITGLKCKGNTKDFEYPESTLCRLFQKYFPGAIKSMAILYFLHTFILAQIDDSSIAVNEFLMVEDGRYQVYPWGQLHSQSSWIHSDMISILANRCIERNVIPRNCNWRNACSNIVPTPEELDAFDLPEDEHDSPSSPTTTSVNPKIVQLNHIADFDDFSTRPPEQLLRRSSRVSNT
ncbi:hypothetical protein H5410_008063 [Solanum commersonii]|uniref:DUF1985 domain-containing protein n=1 Tax=Solanum commersonii TaxID=4109 RepID=A0A9J6ADV4_SOLCO|nr:hypothetical protein H5410_008063 [Solanum commersonii]